MWNPDAPFMTTMLDEVNEIVRLLNNGLNLNFCYSPLQANCHWTIFPETRSPTSMVFFLWLHNFCFGNLRCMFVDNKKRMDYCISTFKYIENRIKCIEAVTGQIHVFEIKPTDQSLIMATAQEGPILREFLISYGKSTYASN